MTHYFLSFSDLNMLSDSDGSDHLDFQEHSKGELLYFYNYNFKIPSLLLTSLPHHHPCLLSISQLMFVSCNF